MYVGCVNEACVMGDDCHYFCCCCYCSIVLLLDYYLVGLRGKRCVCRCVGRGG